MSYGAICAAGSGPQAAAGIADTPEALVEDPGALSIHNGASSPARSARGEPDVGPLVDELAPCTTSLYCRCERTDFV